MKITTLAGLALASVSLCACAGMPGIIGGATSKDVLTDIQACKRHYTGTFGATGFNGSADISCDPVTNGEFRPLGALQLPANGEAAPATPSPFLPVPTAPMPVGK